MLYVILCKILLIKVHFRETVYTSHRCLGENDGVILSLVEYQVPQAETQELLSVDSRVCLDYQRPFCKAAISLP